MCSGGAVQTKAAARWAPSAPCPTWRKGCTTESTLRVSPRYPASHGRLKRRGVWALLFAGFPYPDSRSSSCAAASVSASHDDTPKPKDSTDGQTWPAVEQWMAAEDRADNVARLGLCCWSTIITLPNGVQSRMGGVVAAMANKRRGPRHCSGRVTRV